MGWVIIVYNRTEIESGLLKQKFNIVDVCSLENLG